MTRARDYPSVSADKFPRPPLSFTDAADREIDIAAYGDGPIDVEREALVTMYTDFESADRAQGIPPNRECDIREWLDTLLVEDAVNVLAWLNTDAVGHAILVGDREECYELAIFVHHPYQGAGIGSELIRALLGEGAEQGVECIWLTVERWNTAAMNLYRGVGFEIESAEHFEMEMTLRLD